MKLLRTFKPYKWLLFSALLFPSCSKEEGDTPDSLIPAINFVKLDTGFFREYKVEVWRYVPALDGVADSSVFYHRYEHKEQVKLQDGTQAIKIERFRRSSTSDQWIFDSTFLLWRDRLGILESRSNRTHLLLPTTFRNGTIWNFNQLNSLPVVNSEIINSTSFFDSFKNLVYAQIEKRPVNFVDSRDKYILFAKGLGEVVHYDESLIYFQGDRFGRFIPESGMIYKESLTDYGNIQ